MLGNKNINGICWVVIVCSVVIAALFTMAAIAGRIEANAEMGYESRLFDTSRVHTIDIVMDDWDEFIRTAAAEEYSACTIIIDGVKYSNVGIRAKGNSSLSSVASYGNDRYSFKIEFDQYQSGNSYYGLDKISLNNLIFDNTYMKDHLTYQMMAYVGVNAPLSSFVYITVNGKDWGLYMAAEGIEDGFLQRNYGTAHGALYKPDSMNMGGGRGAGANFDMDAFMDGGDIGRADRFGGRNGNNVEGFGGMGSADVSLQYINNDPGSYPNIFDNAKTQITDADKTRLIASLKKLSEGETVEAVVDIDAVIRYFVVHNFVQNGDSYTGSMVHNYYLYEENGVLAMLPWDYNMAFGGFGGAEALGGATADVNAPIDSPVTSGTLESRPMVAWIFEDEGYTALYHRYFAEYIEGYFNGGHFERMLDATVDLISPYIAKDPTAFCTYDEFVLGIETLRAFCLLRAESVYGQLNGAIPSTQEGQRADGASLVDASHVLISDMGGMARGGMGGFGNARPNPNGGANPAEMPGTEYRPNADEMLNMEGRPNAGGMPNMENRPNTDRMPGRGGDVDANAVPGSFGASATSGGGTLAALLGGSVLFLAVGLITAKNYKK